MAVNKKSIRPSQATRTFGPGSIYDTQQDSMIIMGIDKWKPEFFKTLADEILLGEIKRSNQIFERVEKLVLVSSQKYADEDKQGKIPVRSFPSWGLCPQCRKLVPDRNYKDKDSLCCDSIECQESLKNSKIKKIPLTYPVRYVTACQNGHLDEFPWYEWVHRTDEMKDACSRENARMYLIDEPDSLSLDSKTLECRNCGRNAKMIRSLSKNGLQSVRFGCTGRQPWLDRHERCRSSDNTHVQMRGMFKGSSSMYFPMTRSAVTIPPFSDDLAIRMKEEWDEVKTFSVKSYFRDWMIEKFKLQSEEFPKSVWTYEDALEKLEKMKNFIKEKEKTEIKSLEYDELNSGKDYNDREFVLENIKEIPEEFAGTISKLVLVKKIRIISAITGFTRIDSYAPGGEISISSISKEPPTWLPAVENRGEAIFISLNNEKISKWSNKDEVIKRLESLMTYQGINKTIPTKNEHSPRYVMIHTLSHALIKSLGRVSGYSEASFSERIYADNDKAGILIYTASPSSDGALGGLTELGRKNKNKIWNALRNALWQMTSCSYDPLCSMSEPEKTSNNLGAACQGCVLLPETCCENMNGLLDRELTVRTMKTDIGFFKV